MNYRSLRLLLLLPAAFVLLPATPSLGRSHHQAPGPDSNLPAPTPLVTGLGEVTVRGTRIDQMDSTHLRIAVELSTIATRTVTLENLRLTALRLNDMPVFADAIDQRIDLVKGKDTQLPPIYVTAQFRDLTSVAPLRAILESQTVHVQGQIVAGVKMSFLEKLVLHTEHPRVSLPLSEDVPVAFDSSPLAKQAALGVLTLLELGLQGSSAAVKTVPGLQAPWLHDLQHQADSSLVEVESSYALRQQDTTYPVILDQLGFRISSGLVITTAEAKAPWEYDAEFLGKIKSGEAKLEKKTMEIQIRGTGNTTDAPLLMSHKDFKLQTRGDSDKDGLIVEQGQSGDLAKVNVRRRAAPNALAILVLHAPPPAGGFTIAPASAVQQDRWEKTAVFRLVTDATSGKQSVEIVEIPAHREGQSIRFDHPMDSSFFGSPVLLPEGVLGMVQDEDTGAFLPADVVANSATVPAGI